MNPSAIGTLYCIVSAVCYTMMNICQRELSENCDPVWVNSVQAMVSTTVFGIYLTFRSIRGRSAWPPFSVAFGLVVLGIVTQLGGSSYQWSLGVIGLAIGNPLNMGTMLAVSALLGLLVLGEKISWRGGIAILLITASVFLLSHGAEETADNALSSDSSTADSARAMDSEEVAPRTDGAYSQNLTQTHQVSAVKTSSEVAPRTDGAYSQNLTQTHQVSAVKTSEVDARVDGAATASALRAALGVVAACLAGVAFAVLIVGVRKTARENTAPEAIVFFINLMGVAFLGPWAVMRLGLDGMMAVSPRDYGVMLAIGTFNLFGFLFVTKGLQRTTVVRVNIITNALTTALSVLAGIVIFIEPTNRELVVGIALILIGMLLISINDPSDEKLSVE